MPHALDFVLMLDLTFAGGATSPVGSLIGSHLPPGCKEVPLELQDIGGGRF